LSSRIGRFELADGGTLLLDEVSEISLPLQAKLLRVLQERELERVGGTRTIKVDVRIIATTNRDLHVSVEKGEFREDLFYRLNVFPVHSPALRERKGDIPAIATSFLHEFARKHGRKLDGFSPAALDLMTRHEWPGNVRELQNVVERAVILSLNSKSVEPAALPMEFSMLQGNAGAAGVAQAAALAAAVAGAAQPATDDQPTIGTAVASGAVDVIAEAEDMSLAAVERQLILRSLERCDGNRSKAAELMGVSIRTLRNKLAQYREEGRAEFAAYFAN
jgi:DNA-binding NtrC family response regulator